MGKRKEFIDWADIRLEDARTYALTGVRVIRNAKGEIASEPKPKKPRNPDHQAKVRLKAYGLDDATYKAMLEHQGGLCAICMRNGRMVVDHCHASGRVRQLLCHKCNCALGLLDDNADWLIAAAAYLIRHR